MRLETIAERCGVEPSGYRESNGWIGEGDPCPVSVLHVLEATEGGTRRWLENVVTGLDPARVRSACVCSLRRDPGFAEVVERFRRQGVPVWVVDMRREISPAADLRALSQVTRILREEQFDVVHGHSAKGGMIARLAARRAGHSCAVYTPHAFPFLAGGLSGLVYRALERCAIRLTRALLAVSEAEAQAARDLGYPPSKVHLVRNAVASAPETENVATRNPAAPVVGGAASLRPQKDPLAFVEVCALVSRLRPDARFQLCGAGPLEGAVRCRRRATGLEGKLELLRPVPDAAHLPRGWNVFLFCSRYEGLSYALLEAMAAGTPVVAMAAPGVAEVVQHEETGLLVPPGDIPAAASAVVRLLADPKLAQRLGEAARQHVLERYSLEEQLERLTRFYETLTHERRASICVPG